MLLREKPALFLSWFYLYSVAAMLEWR